MSNYQYLPHPLLLPNIVHNVLQHFDDGATLHNLRLVSHCWNLEASNLIRSSKIITFETESSLASYNQIFKNTFNTFGVFAHSQYNFAYRLKQEDRLNSSDINGILLPEAIQNFTSHFGNYVTSLTLKIGSGHFNPLLVNSIFCLIPHATILGLHFCYFKSPIPHEFSEKATTNLKTVHTIILQIEGFETSEESATEFLFLMFRYMPNLRKLSYPGEIRRISKIGLFLRDAVLDTVTNLKKLCHWEFKTRLLEEDALKLLCKEFPMKTLTIDLYNPDNDFDCISSSLMAGLLLKWANCLEQLAVEFPWRKEVTFHFHFPSTMQHLTFLYLGGFEGVLTDLLKRLPRLKRLELSQLELMSIVPKPDSSDVYPSVKLLRLDFCAGQTAGVFSRLSRIFPELISLNLNHTTNEVALMIFQKMTHLIRLRMHSNNDLTDAGMCGFSEAALKGEDFLVLTPTQGNRHRTYPFIADLPELQYLELDAYALTEITVRHGLVHCTSLKVVKLDSSGNSTDTSTICRKFRLSEYGKHMVEEKERNHALIEMKEEPPFDEDALEFFKSHENLYDDLLNA